MASTSLTRNRWGRIVATVRGAFDRRRDADRWQALSRRDQERFLLDTWADRRRYGR